MTQRKGFVFPILFMLTLGGCASTNLVLPDSRAWLDNPSNDYPFLAKECRGPKMRVRLYLKNFSADPNAVWNDDAFIEILPPSDINLPPFGYIDIRPTLPNGKRLSRTFGEIFFIDNTLFGENLALLNIKQIFSRVKKESRKKIFFIRPNKDITVGEYIDGTGRFASQYLMLVEQCFYGFN